MDFVVLALVFALFSGLTWGSYLVWTRRLRDVEPRLQPRNADDAAPALLLGDMTSALAEQIPMGEDQRTTLQRELHLAGYYRPTAMMEYNALRAVLVIVPLFIAGIISLFLDELNSVLTTWGVAVAVSMLGFSFPRIFVYYKGLSRSVGIERGLPTAIEMLTLCLTAGQNVLQSLARVAKEVALAYPDLSFELQIVERQAELRSLEEALAAFARRAGIPHLRNLAVILTQSEHLGTDAVGILREYADHMRTNQRQRAQELANRAPFKLLFPAYVMAFGAAILIISPPILELGAMRRTNMLGQSRDLVPNATQQPVVPSPTSTNTPTPGPVP